MAISGCIRRFVVFSARISLPAVAVFENARAEDVSVASVRLRGGFDDKPALQPGGKGSAFAGFDAAFAAGTSKDDYKAGFVGEASRTQYLTGPVEPSERYKTAVEIANINDERIAFRSTSSVDTIRNYELHSFD